MSELVAILRDAVARAIDNPFTTCATLSGGLDSSTVVSLAPHPIATFTGWYDALGCDEREYARAVARAADTNHHEIQVTPEDFVRYFDDYADAVRHLPDYAGVGGLGQYVVAREIALRGYETVLSGEGSDELFGGYVRASRLADGYVAPPEYAAYVPPAGYPDTHEAALRHDLGQLPTLLAVDDAVLAAQDLVGRTPFLDPRVVCYALSLPASERVNKDHLRRAVRGVVPDVVIDRTDKRGFPAPFVAWANEVPSVREFVGDRLGYLPDPSRPYARDWFHELIRAGAKAAA